VAAKPLQSEEMLMSTLKTTLPVLAIAVILGLPSTTQAAYT
jgi:hypothetical protein